MSLLYRRKCLHRPFAIVGRSSDALKIDDLIWGWGFQMSVRQFASKMRQDVEAMKSNGVASIYVDHLITYLASVENAPEPSTAQIEQNDFNPRAEAYRHESAARLEGFRSTITAGQNAIRTMVIINGGASVALLAFLGPLMGREGAPIQAFAYCMLYFVFGTLAAGLVAGMTYLSQWLYGQGSRKFEIGGGIANAAAVVLGLASYYAFGKAAWLTYQAFIALPA